jgi:hypothetical protein
MKKETKRYAYEGVDGIYVGSEINGNVVPTRLTDFFVKIITEKSIVSGNKNSSTSFLVYVYDSKKCFVGEAEIGADKFMDMKWLFSIFGNSALINSDVKGGKNILADFILRQCCEGKKCIVYKSPGFHLLNNKLVFVHESGIIGEDAFSANAHGEFEKQQKGIDLGRRVKDPDQKRRNAMHLVNLMFIGGDGNPLIGIAAVATVIRSVLTAIDGIPFAPLFLVGSTGSYKTSLAELMQSFFGSTRCSQKLMLTLDSSISDVIEAIRSLSGSLIVVDDFLYKSGKSNMNKFNELADLVLRGSANESYRETMSSNHSLCHPVVVVTGEHIPAMVEESLLARTVFVDATGTPFDSIAQAQIPAKNGEYASGMREFIKYVIKNIRCIGARWESNKDQMCAFIKDSSTGEMHSRFPEQYAGLLFSCCEYLRYLKVKGYISKDEREVMREQFKKGIVHIACTQKSIWQRKSIQEAIKNRLLSLFDTGVMTIVDEGMIILKNSPSKNKKFGKGICIGRLDENDSNLLFDANFIPADIFGSDWIVATGLPLTKVAFYKRIKEVGLLVAGTKRLTHRIRIGKCRTFRQFYKIKLK